MTNARYSRRFILGGLLSGVAGAAWAEPPATSLRPRLRPEHFRTLGIPSAEELVAEARLDGRTAFATADAATGRVLESRDGEIALPPASVAKTVTTLYALDVLGPDHRFRTRIVGTGPVEDGTLKGDLVLAGGGDPMLDTDALADLAAGLKEAGVFEVEGRFLYWGGGLPDLRVIDAGQPDQVGYNPGISGLNLNYNRVHFAWTRADGDWTVTMDARTANYRPDVTMAQMRVVDRTTPIYTYADADGIDDWTVAASALGQGGSRWLPVRRPAIYAAEVFQTLARSHGIVLDTAEPAPTAPEGTELAGHDSIPLTEILRLMLLYSNNLVAEVVGLSSSVVRARGDVPSLSASARMMNAWAKLTLGMEEIGLVDHSGLGDASRVTATDLVRMLAHPLARDSLRPLLKEIELRDDQGRPQRDHPMQVEAKTGSLNFVSALAGYAAAPDGQDMAFAIMSADLDRRAALTVEQRERPEGGRAWLGRARALQQGLIERWGALYAA